MHGALVGVEVEIVFSALGVDIEVVSSALASKPGDGALFFVRGVLPTSIAISTSARNLLLSGVLCDVFFGVSSSVFVSISPLFGFVGDCGGVSSPGAVEPIFSLLLVVESPSRGVRVVLCVACCISLSCAPT